MVDTIVNGLTVILILKMQEDVRGKMLLTECGRYYLEFFLRTLYNYSKYACSSIKDRENALDC